MEDPDWIQIAYVFDEEPSAETYEAFLEELPSYPGPEYGPEEFDVSFRDKENGHENTSAGKQEAVSALTTSESCSIEVSMDRYGLGLGFSKDGKGLLSSSSLPYLQFTTTIYAFREPDDELLEEVRRRRREFVEVLARAADVLEPVWGFGRRTGLAIGDDESVEDLASTVTPPLYEYNVFRRETVEELGRERVRSAPAWYVEELDSGGVFIAIREPPQRCSKRTEACNDVAEHLGIPLASPDRYY